MNKIRMEKKVRNMKRKTISISVCALMITAVFVGISGAATAVDDWGTYQHDPQNSGFSSSEMPDTPRIAWSKVIPRTNSPVVADGKVYLSTETSPYIQCLDADDGHELWNTSLTGRIKGMLTVVDGKVYAGAYNKHVYCFDSADGSLLWNTNIGQSIATTPTVADGKVYITSIGRAVHCLDAITGSPIFVTHSQYKGNNKESPPIVADDKVYTTSRNRIYCFYSSNGSFIWGHTYSTMSPLSIADGKVYFDGEYHGNVYCLNADNGSFIWSYDTDGQTKSSISIADGKVYVGCNFHGNVYCLNADNGSFIWSYDTGDSIMDYIDSPLSIADDKVYVGSSGLHNGKLYCLNATTGEQNWYIPMVGLVFSSAIVDGKIYVSAGDNVNYAQVYCIDAGATPPTPNQPPIGPTSVNVGGSVDVIYYTDNAPGEDTYFYLFDWGDGNNSGWKDSPVAGYDWPMGGVFDVKVQVKTECGSVVLKSDWSDPLEVTVNDAPYIIDMDGPTHGPIGINHSFIVELTDPEGDDIFFFVDWGDGNNSGWLGPFSDDTVEVEIVHQWSYLDSFPIRIETRDDIGAQHGYITVMTFQTDMLDIEVSGGSGVFVTIKNIGIVSKHVNWSVDLVPVESVFSVLHMNNFLGRFPGYYEYQDLNGSILVKSNSNETVSTPHFVAFGWFEVTVSVDCAGEQVVSETMDAFMIFSHVVILGSLLG